MSSAAPGPSAMRGAAMRLAEFLSTYSADARQEATAPTVEDGPLVVEAGRIEIVTTGSIMALRCPRQLTTVCALFKRTGRVPRSNASTDTSRSSGSWSPPASGSP